ncbi:MAG: AAA family ATPase [Planctomycetota bacterium]
MTLEESNLVLKYFDLLDEFVRVRLLPESEVGALTDTAVRSKSDYRQALIRQCIPDFSKDIAQKLRQLEEDYDPLTIEDLLYQVCIDVNPGLEIHQVCIPVKAEAGGETPEQLERLAKGALVPRNIQNLSKILRRRIVGQDEAVAMLAKAVQKAAIGLQRPHSPVGTFFLAGRTGTGKTEIAKALTEALYHEKSRLIRIDCSEYALPHEYAKLIGAPPGYIGHAEGGYLTEAVKTKKQCIVLFDEIEKAHYKVHNLLLQILDEGILTDSKGETVSFSDCVILLTSNLGVDEVNKIQKRMGFDHDIRRSLNDIDHETITREALKESFRPEFLNRIDEIIVFNPLNVDVCTRIAGMMLSDIASILASRSYQLRFSGALKRRIAVEGFSEEYGARELKRLVKRMVEDPIAEAILDGDLQPGSSLFVRKRSGKVVVECKKADVDTMSSC